MFKFCTVGLVLLLGFTAACTASVEPSQPASEPSKACAEGWIYCDDPTPPSAPCDQEGNKCACYTAHQCGLWHGGQF